MFYRNENNGYLRIETEDNRFAKIKIAWQNVLFDNNSKEWSEECTAHNKGFATMPADEYILIFWFANRLQFRLKNI